MQLEVRKKFAQVVRELRGSQGYREFARKIGISHPTVGAWENLKGIPDTESLRKIASLRGETLEEFEAFLGGNCKPDQIQRVIQQIQIMSDIELAIVLKAIAKRWRK